MLSTSPSSQSDQQIRESLKKVQQLRKENKREEVGLLERVGGVQAEGRRLEEEEKKLLGELELVNRPVKTSQPKSEEGSIVAERLTLNLNSMLMPSTEQEKGSALAESSCIKSTSSSSSSGFNDVPSEAALKDCNTLIALTRLASVTKRFRKIIMANVSLWKVIKQRDNHRTRFQAVIDNTLLKLEPQVLAGITEISLIYFKIEASGVLSLLQHLPGLKTLDLSCGNSVEPSDLCQLLEEAGNLGHLKLESLKLNSSSFYLHDGNTSDDSDLDPLEDPFFIQARDCQRRLFDVLSRKTIAGSSFILCPILCSTCNLGVKVTNCRTCPYCHMEVDAYTDFGSEYSYGSGGLGNW